MTHPIPETFNGSLRFQNYSVAMDRIVLIYPHCPGIEEKSRIAIAEQQIKINSFQHLYQYIFFRPSIKTQTIIHKLLAVKRKRSRNYVQLNLQIKKVSSDVPLPLRANSRDNSRFGCL